MLSITEFIYDTFSCDYAAHEIKCCTEYKRDCIQMQCHPSYQGEGPWFDWVNVSFAISNCNGIAYPTGLYPCKVVVVVPHEKNDFLNEMQLVVQCSTQHSEEGDSVLFKEWKMSEVYECISASSVNSSLFVLEVGEGKIPAAVPYSEWPGLFMDTSYS